MNITFDTIILVDDMPIGTYEGAVDASPTRGSRYAYLLEMLSEEFHSKINYVISSDGILQLESNSFKTVDNVNLFDNISEIESKIVSTIKELTSEKDKILILIDYQLCTSNESEDKIKEAKAASEKIIEIMLRYNKYKIILFSIKHIDYKNKNQNFLCAEKINWGSISTAGERFIDIIKEKLNEV